MFVDIKKDNLKDYSDKFSNQNPGSIKSIDRIEGSGALISDINVCLLYIERLSKKTDDLFKASSTYLGKAASNFKSADDAVVETTKAATKVTTTVTTTKKK